MPLCEGRPAARIHIFIMLSTAADLAAALVANLPPDVRKIVEAHFLTASLFSRFSASEK